MFLHLPPQCHYGEDKGYQVAYGYACPHSVNPELFREDYEERDQKQKLARKRQEYRKLGLPYRLEKF